MAIVWKFYQDGGDQIDVDLLYDVKTLLTDTAQVHIRDFEYSDIPTLVIHVNEKVQGRNWLKMHCRYNNDNLDIAICYHLLKHRGYKWSVSVGFNQGLLPQPDLQNLGDVEDPLNPYVVLALFLGKIIKDDLHGFTPRHRELWMVDDIGTQADGSEPEMKQRKTPIGELNWTFMKSNLVRNQVGGTISGQKEPKPIGPHGYPIPGYGRPYDTYVYVQEVRFS